MSKTTPANVLVFSGLDPTGGAGIQADIETISSIGATACSIITALTVQNTKSVQRFSNVDSQLIDEQARCILNDIPVNCIKLGMLADVDIINVIAAIICDFPDIKLVIDPIFSAGGGGDLTNSTAFNQLLTQLIPKASIITPNSLEARQLLPGTTNLATCAEQILNNGCLSVLITDCQEESDEVSNVLYTQTHSICNNWPRLPNDFHGSGCTLSSSIAAYLALGQDLESAVYNGQQYTYNTLLNAKKIGLGQLIPDRYFKPDKLVKES